MNKDFLPKTWDWDVTQAPFHADPTGERDSTKALIAAMNAVTALTMAAMGETVAELAALPFHDGYHPDGFENRKVNGKLVGILPARLPYVPTLYLPAGQYRISDTISYEHLRLCNTAGSELNSQIRIRGAGPGLTTIKLIDNAPAFQGSEPKPVLSVMKEHRTNVAMSNYVEDLTIDVGSGNPAALGLDFYANNSGAVRNVVIRSGDGAACIGLAAGHANFSGILFKNIHISGFQTGLHADSTTATMYLAGEDIRIDDCQVAVFAGKPSLSLRKVRATGCETGIVADGAGGLLVLLDSEFEGTGPMAIEHRNGFVYLSNVQMRGFAGDELITERVLPESPEAEGATMARLPVEDAPTVPASNHTCLVNDFGAIGDGKTDATAAIQAALDSGAVEVHFGPGKYLLDAPVTIPATVCRMAFHFVDIVAGPTLKQQSEQGAFIIAGDAGTPLVFEDLFAWEQWSGAHYTIDHASPRTLVISDVHTQTLPLYRNSVSGGKVFLENVACTAGVIPGSKGHDRVCMEFTGQQVWARQVNPERGEPMVRNDGGTLWVLGYKTEDDATAFHTINGGQTEILGGVLNCGGVRHASFVTEDSRMRVSTTSNGWSLHNRILTAIQEIRNGAESVILAEDFPSRGLEPKRGAQIIIPLYSSPLAQAPDDAAQAELEVKSN